MFCWFVAVVRDWLRIGSFGIVAFSTHSHDSLKSAPTSISIVTSSSGALSEKKIILNQSPETWLWTVILMWCVYSTGGNCVVWSLRQRTLGLVMDIWIIGCQQPSCISFRVIGLCKSDEGKGVKLLVYLFCSWWWFECSCVAHRLDCISDLSVAGGLVVEVERGPHW